MTEISAIPIFVAVAETGGFAAAARQLGITKGAVSKRVSGLEARLGTQLFHRSTRSVSLTEAGEIYLAYAVQALGYAREGEDAVATLQGQPTGQLRVSAPMSFGRIHVAPLVTDFLEQFPKINLDLTMDDRMVDLIEAGFDVAIRAGSMPDSALIARRLATVRSVVVAAPSYLAKNGAPTDPAQLVDYNCLHYAYSRDPMEWLFLSDGDQMRVRTKGSLRVNNSEALCVALVDGLGIGRLPTFVAGSHIKAGRLHQVLPGFSMPEQALFAVFPERRHMPAKTRVFLDFLVKRIGSEQPYWDIEAGLSS
ncbi:HTH-type transcriptional regulator DmlR [Pseudovibrio axinellae]|uniref:HTH-type transcriptional regulator DmlR n=1 Tax=Pseudovibrio axinellae TaxID=989403 RepID=A0A165YZH1_9HYPH|nr:LysR family transcriptional regulator [Pseudovibrio axinellae]KZL19374.1 HTH-type transcriptional regulator DmlR [Pseudovibrio axinellae]SEQ39107.1 DNA-binding transcriptional regulator, LysR family [Pseudovibrio axinellae]